jgi:hypothetical protein
MFLDQTVGRQVDGNHSGIALVQIRADDGDFFGLFGHAGGILVLGG